MVVIITEKKEWPFVVLLPVAFQGFENCARKKNILEGEAQLELIFKGCESTRARRRHPIRALPTFKLK